MKLKKQSKGFALVTGLLMLLVLTLLATVVMRGTTLELAMTTAVTKQEQALVLADSARSLSRELLIASIEFDNTQPGRDKSEAVAGRKANVPLFATMESDCTASGGDDLGGGVLGTPRNYATGLENAALTTASIDSNLPQVMQLRIQTLNAVPGHIPGRNSARLNCESGTMRMAVIDISRKIKEGSDVTNPEIIKTVGLIGFGSGLSGVDAKVASISDILINAN